MNKKLSLNILLLCSLTACVKTKVYKAEALARSAAEAREKVLGKYLEERKAESLTLTNKVSELSKTIGNQEAEIRSLRAELSSKTQTLGESSNKLAQDKAALERQLQDHKATLQNREVQLDKIKKAQQSRQDLLASLYFGLNQLYNSLEPQGVEIRQEAESVLLTLPDQLLFEPTGSAISSGGKSLLKPLASFLSVRPELPVDIVAYTDNILPPKDKSLKDTWDWSLARATNIARMLAREYNVNANQLTPVGRGEFFPLSSNETPEGRQKNRRTVVVLKPDLEKIPAAE